MGGSGALGYYDAMSAAALIVLVTCVVFVGAVMQRISGMGLGLLAAPVLSIVLDPVIGILVVNVLASVNALMATVSVRASVDWRRFMIIASVMILGVIPGVLLINAVSPSVLQVIVGAVLLAALGIVTLGKRYVPRATGTGPAITAGVVGGFTNTLAGVAAPAITVYGQAARWEHRSFASTLQPLFVVAGVVSFGVKIVMGTGDFGGIPVALWPMSVISMALAIALGARIAPRVPRSWAHRMAITLAALGALSVMVKGLIALIAA